MTTPVYFLVPGDPATPTGGFVYDRRMIAALAAAGRLAGVVRLPDRFPEIDSGTRAKAAAALAALPVGAALIVDGLGLAPLAVELAARPDLRLIGLVHHPLCDESGLSAAARTRWFEAERCALARAAHLIVTSAGTAARLADFKVTPDRISVVRPGVDATRSMARGRARLRPADDGPLRLLCVGSLVPRKGQDVLLAALSRLKHLDWHLDLVGAARDPAYARRLRLALRQRRLVSRVCVAGSVSEPNLAAFYRRAALFVLPSRHEGYGMALADAVAAGLTVVTTKAGGTGEAVAGGVVVFVPPDRPAALAAALRSLLSRFERRQGMHRRARAAVRAVRSWADAEAEFVAVIDGETGR